jgi:hypothetical protein
MNTNLNSDFSKHVERLLTEGNNTKLFTEGCCFHFALRLHFDRRIPFIEGCFGQSDSVPNTFQYPHIWLGLRDYAFDATGVYDRAAYRDTMKKRFGVPDIAGFSTQLIMQKIDSKPLSSSILNKVYGRAIHFFDTDPKFQCIRQLASV